MDPSAALARTRRFIVTNKKPLLYAAGGGVAGGLIAWLYFHFTLGSATPPTPTPANTASLQPLLDMANQAGAAGFIDKALGGQAQRISDLQAENVTFAEVPYYNQNPERHSANTVLVRFFFDIHIPTPVICSDANGDISAYIYPFIDEQGRLRILVDGWSFNYSGGEPACRPTIDSKLNEALPGAMQQLQETLNQQLAPIDGVVVNRS
jgi:hypothetical protein